MKRGKGDRVSLGGGDWQFRPLFQCNLIRRSSPSDTKQQQPRATFSPFSPPNPCPIFLPCSVPQEADGDPSTRPPHPLLPSRAWPVEIPGRRLEGRQRIWPLLGRHGRLAEVPLPFQLQLAPGFGHCCLSLLAQARKGCWLASHAGWSRVTGLP